jgi:hypothetical protein
MEPLTEPQIRAAFVNCSKGEAQRLPVPRDLAARPWDDLDFLGWRDPRSADRAYLVTVLGGRPQALVLRCPAARGLRRGMCSICLTTHTGGVSLMVAPKAGKAGRQGDTVGTYVCSDLACSLYVRGRKQLALSARLEESLTVDEKVARTTANLASFIARVTDA